MRDRVALGPGPDLLGWPILPGVGPGVTARPVGDRFDQRWAAALAGRADRTVGRQVDGVGVVAVDHDLVQPVRGRASRRRMRDRGHDVDRRVLHIEVVLADEHGRQVPDLRHVEGLVERPDVGRPVPEERDRDVVGAPHLGRPGRAVRGAEVRADDGVGAHHALRDVGQVHRAALAAEDPVLPAEELGHRRPRIHAARERVRMATVGGERVVAGTQDRAEPGGDRLHAEREVRRALHEVLQEQVVGALAELPQQLQGAVHADPNVQVDRRLGEAVIDGGGEPRRPRRVVVPGISTHWRPSTPRRGTT